MIYNGQVKHTVQSLYNTPPYNTDFVITKSCCGHNEMVIFLSISLNLFILQEHLAILLTSTLEINCNLGSFFKQGYRYHKLLKTFPKFYWQYYDLISKFQVGLKSLLRQGLSEPEIYGDLVYKLKKIVGSDNFSAQLK